MIDKDGMSYRILLAQCGVAMVLTAQEQRERRPILYRLGYSAPELLIKIENTYPDEFDQLIDMASDGEQSDAFSEILGYASIFFDEINKDYELLG